VIQHYRVIALRGQASNGAVIGYWTRSHRLKPVLAVDLALALALALALVFDLDLPRRKAERRFCVVGNPAWMPG